MECSYIVLAKTISSFKHLLDKKTGRGHCQRPLVYLIIILYSYCLIK